MKIIDNKKDYYDYLAGIYGIDDLIVYDRRGSISSRDILEAHPVFFSKNISELDEPRQSYSWSKSEWSKFYSHVKLTMIVEIGYKHYYIDVNRYRLHPEDPITISYTCYNDEEYWKKKYGRDENNNSYHPSISRWRLEWEEKRKKELSRKFSNKPISICFTYDDAKDYSLRNGTHIVENPILKDLPGIAGNIPAESVWQNLYDYISSTKDKVIVDNRTDIQHLESAGFDKKTSFRKM